jgi:hypothetical protein
MTDNRLRRPKPVDLQRALAFITASVRGDEAVATLWDAAVEEGRDLMLALALATLAKQPAMMSDLLGDLVTNPVTTMVNMTRATEAVAAMDNDGSDDDDDDDWPDEEEWRR